MVKKSDMWRITHISTITSDVQFEQPVTMEAARKLFLNDDYFDIVDEDFGSANEVLSLEPFDD